MTSSSSPSTKTNPTECGKCAECTHTTVRGNNVLVEISKSISDLVQQLLSLLQQLPPPAHMRIHTAVAHIRQQRALPDCTWTQVLQRVERSCNPVEHIPAVNKNSDLKNKLQHIFQFQSIKTFRYGVAILRLNNIMNA